MLAVGAAVLGTEAAVLAAGAAVLAAGTTGLVTVLAAAAAAEEMIPVALEIGGVLSADALAVQTELAATAKMLTATTTRSLKSGMRIRSFLKSAIRILGFSYFSTFSYLGFYPFCEKLTRSGLRRYLLRSRTCKAA